MLRLLRRVSSRLTPVYEAKSGGAGFCANEARRSLSVFGACVRLRGARCSLRQPRLHPEKPYKERMTWPTSLQSFEAI